MTFDLRGYHEDKLSYTLEGMWSDAVKLVNPIDGEEDNVTGQVLWDSKVEDPKTGAEIVMDCPVATVRRSSLARVPKDGEKWSIWVPKSNTDDTPVMYMLERARRHGSLGMLRLYLTLPEQEDLAP